MEKKEMEKKEMEKKETHPDRPTAIII